MQKLSFFIALVLLLTFGCDNSDPPAEETSPQNAQSQTDSTLTALNKQIVDEPNNPEGFLNRARLYFKNNEPKLALEDMNRALKIDSLNASMTFERGEIYYSLFEFDKARADYDRCVKLNPEEVECLLKLGEIDIHLRNYPQAIERINNALRINEQLPFAYYMKGRIYKETGDTTLAASSYQTAIEVDPDYYDAYIEIGLLYTAAKSDLAIEYFKTAIEIRPKSVEALYNLAYYYQVTGVKNNDRFQRAFDLYDRILEVDPQNAIAPYNKGFIHLEYFQNYDSAITYFSQAADLYPGYFQAYYNRGLALESLDRAQEALADYNRALSLQPDFTPAAIAKGRILGE